ncbi:hypothetical protein C8A05DRAFT_16895, partial [Staphylotrichum tortipilum]
TKGGLLQDSYRWILDNPEFQQWRDNPKSRLLLWIEGDPGKGKTMLLCGIINELERDSTTDVCYRNMAYVGTADSNHYSGCTGALDVTLQRRAW